MKRYLVLLLAFTGMLAAQDWEVRLLPAPPTQFFIEHMWNCLITNTETQSVDVTIYAWMTKDGDEIAHGRSNQINISPGGKRITSADITDVSDEWYDPDYEDIISRRGAMPAGRYTYCLQVELARGDTILAQDCAQHSTVRASKLKLLTPQDEAGVTPQPTFIWAPLVQSYDDLTYRLRIVEVPEEMTPYEAISAAEPWFEDDSITKTSFAYPMWARILEEDKTYAWRVDAWSDVWKVSTSDVRSFVVGEPVIEADTTDTETSEE
ncbi:hypothetical protein GF359_01640 [candidate division WOR-3 bacterium]|uniref:Uncharacterized protein n=1 Tax=candidate division WOR-3 bacterium TaxID=2052148 RepID=A0A9D5QCD6_UNCW3|nr:hypothetical protein [candidate division WOR-3 bacterium]MBD3363896.1 hypothetical protein [candidate division WOR-3 bacterium]